MAPEPEERPEHDHQYSKPLNDHAGDRHDDDHHSNHDDTNKHPQNHGNDHEERHDDAQEGDHDHGHGEGESLFERIKHFLIPHSHGHQVAALDAALATDQGLWAVKVSLVALLATAVFQVVIVYISGSVALLADTIHNFSDALTAVPLGLAFTLSRRARNPRYTYGYGRAEDIAGVIIVLMILFSAGEVIYHSARKLVQPEPVDNLGWVAVAAIIGFLGNELVAIYRIRTGQRIGSAALIADGYHARTDGFTSLAVLAGAAGVWMGYPLMDPLVGLGIGLAILAIVWVTARDMWYRIMDAVDPEITGLVEERAKNVPGVLSIHSTAIRWVGHRQRAELHTVVDCKLSTKDSHDIAEQVRHELFHALPALVDVTVHVDPCECEDSVDYHITQHHESNS